MTQIYIDKCFKLDTIF